MARTSASAWRPPDPEQRDVVEVAKALVTPVTTGPLRTDRGPVRWIRGAVHDSDGGLVRLSQRCWNGERHDPVAADPKRVPVPRLTPRLGGTWVYAGHWANHFGHFLLELLPNLWPDAASLPAPPAGILVHRPARGRVPVTEPGRAQRPALSRWQQELMELAGYAGADVRVVGDRPVRVERLLVPSRPVLLKRWALPPAVDLWRRVSEAVGRRGDSPRVYLSRTRFHSGRVGAGRARTKPAWDARLDDLFAEAGFLVVHPETLPIGEQIALVRGADVLAGLSGSALHLSAFATPGTRVVVVGDRRSPRRPTRAQTMIDLACGHRTAFLPPGDEAGLAAALADPHAT